MPKRDSAPVGAPCWVDVMSSDIDRTTEFYGDLFGWTVEIGADEIGGYRNFSKDGLLVAGGMANTPEMEAPDCWSIYLATPDARATVDAAQAGGATVIVPAMDVLTLGTMAVVTDTGGAVIGMWQPGEHKGFGIYDEPGTPAWFELHTRDYEASLQFYRDIFQWKTRVEGDTPEFRYTTLVDGDDQLAGIMDASGFLPDGVPAHWSVYFRVEDTDKALARTVDLGGAVALPAEDTPYGRIAQATDPTGASFKLVS